MSLQASQINDLVTTTLRDLERLKWADIATDLQNHVFMNEILDEQKVKFESGYGHQFNLRVANNGQARHTGLFGTDNVNVADVMITGTVGWVHATTDYAIERREIAMNRDPAKIVDLIKTRRVAALADLAEELEPKGWANPTSGSDDPFGVAHWIVKNATEGFNGGAPSGYTAGAAGISSTTYPRWKNWSAQYVARTKADLITKWRKALTKTNFKPPIEHPSSARGKNRYAQYTNYDVIADIETLAENQNQNLQNDLASKDGMVTVRRIPVTWAPYLDADTSDPIYGVNWAWFYPIFLKGEYMNETPMQQAPSQHTVSKVHIDLSYNYVCKNRRAQFVLYQ
jgi:hypothetical protein